MYKHVALKSLVLMECRSVYLVNFDGAAQVRCYFCGTDEFELDCNNKSLFTIQECRTELRIGKWYFN